MSIFESLVTFNLNMMKKFLSKFFLGFFALSMIALASCGDEKKDEEKEGEGEEEKEGAVTYVITDVA